MLKFQKIFRNGQLNDFDTYFESWNKKRTSSHISAEFIDDIYSKGIKNGALGGRILGAGGGLLFYVDEKK